jgi:hypothetical protein
MRVEDQGTGDWAEETITLKIKPPPGPEKRGDNGSGCAAASQSAGTAFARAGGTGSRALAPFGNLRVTGLAALVSLFAATIAALRWKSTRLAFASG